MFNFTKKEQIVILILVILNISLVGYNVKIKSDVKILKSNQIKCEMQISANNEIDTKKDENKQEKEIVCVDVTGAVAKPGVYELSKGSRIIDAVNKAGGFTEKADRDKINCSKLLYDEQQVHIYKIGEINNLESDEKININTATKQDIIDKIPGIGEVKASSIIKYRQKKKFKDINELLNIEGIKEKTLENIAKYIYVQ
ncbi:ComEA family DNA-binding protein [Clostridiaceae bacterium M8S5]|nr:ComEA family DNA-binding protein [Clostridiaceae bacterium M8S5]